MKQNKSQQLNKTIDKGEVTDTPNPFMAARQMLLSSIGRLPAMLVMILVFAVFAASGTVILMSGIGRDEVVKEFMPQRLKPHDGALAINDGLLQGVWTTSTPEFAMTITLVKNKFEWIIKMRNEGYAIFYLRGNYKISDDVMIFGARNDMGAPSDPIPMGRIYMPIDIVDVNFFVKVDKNKMVWDVPVSEQNCYKTRLINIFNRKNDAQFVWKRVE